MLAESLINQQYFDQVYAESVEAGFEFLLENCESIIKAKKSSENGMGLFVLLDIWHNFNSQFDEVLNILTVHFPK